MQNKIMQKLLCRIFVILCLIALDISAQAPKSITGFKFDEITHDDLLNHQYLLEQYFDESKGYLITGPLELDLSDMRGGLPYFSSIRIICPDINTYYQALEIIKSDSVFSGFDDSLLMVEGAEYIGGMLIGHKGEFAEFNRGNTHFNLQINTIHRNRLMLWMRDILQADYLSGAEQNAKPYMLAVSDYLRNWIPALLTPIHPKPSILACPKNMIFTPNRRIMLLKAMPIIKIIYLPMKKLKPILPPE